MRAAPAFLHLAACSLLALAGEAGETVSRYTADWIRVNIGQVRDQQHSVQVVAVRPGAIDGDAQWFGVFTWDGYGNGSWINALVPTADANTFLKRFGTSTPEYMTDRVRNKRLQCVVRVGGSGQPYLEVGEHAPAGTGIAVTGLDRR
jgi:hypothetical protein